MSADRQFCEACSVEFPIEQLEMCEPGSFYLCGPCLVIEIRESAKVTRPDPVVRPGRNGRAVQFPVRRK